MADIEEEAAELRTVVREAHEAIKDLRRAVKEAGDMVKVLERVSHDVFDARMDAEVKAGLDAYGESIKQAIAKSEQAVFDRFDRLGNTLIGENGAGRPSIEELATAVDISRRFAQYRGTD